MPTPKKLMDNLIFFISPTANLEIPKEKLHKFYRTRGYYRAHLVLRQMCDDMALSLIPEIKTLRRTLLKWKEEILNYFLTGLTNGRTESYNNLAKLVQNRAFGYKSFRNYRLRLLSACA